MSKLVEHRVPNSVKFPIPLILLHGAWHGGWAMSLLASFLVALGFECYILSFSGHENDKKNKRKRIWHTLGRYVKDLEELVGSIGRGSPPILIGHSMGGLIAQMYAKKHPVSALVLLASVPSSGALKVLWRFAIRHPWLTIKFFLTLSLYPAVERLEVVRELFFSNLIKEERIRDWQKKLVAESFLAYLQALIPRAFSCEKMPRQAPVFVLHAELDQLVSEAQSHQTAQSYGADIIILSRTAHCDVLAHPDRAREAVNLIARWLQEQNISSPS